MTRRAKDREAIAAAICQRDELRLENERLRREADQQRTHAREAVEHLAAAQSARYVVEFADGRPAEEFDSDAVAWTTARNASYGGVEARVRHDGALVWAVATHGGGRRADGTSVGPTLRVRFLGAP